MYTVCGASIKHVKIYYWVATHLFRLIKWKKLKNWNFLFKIHVVYHFVSTQNQLLTDYIPGIAAIGVETGAKHKKVFLTLTIILLKFTRCQQFRANTLYVVCIKAGNVDG